MEMPSASGQRRNLEQISPPPLPNNAPPVLSVVVVRRVHTVGERRAEAVRAADGATGASENGRGREAGRLVTRGGRVQLPKFGQNNV